jgi:hypothetical protein
MRVAYPTVTSMGFGNNVIALAKAHLIAESCALTYQRPLWPPTEHVAGEQRGYGHYLPWTVGDKVRVTAFSYLSRLQRKLAVPPWPPCVLFGREDYERTRVTDVGEACRTYLATFGLDDPARSVIVTTNGMWGGYAAIKRARPWINQLLLSHADTRQRFEQIDRAIGARLRVGVNIRMGDFLPPEAAAADRQGERLVRLPLEWFGRICRRLREIADCEIVLVTDGTRDELRPFLDEFHPVDIVGQPFTALLGLVLLRSCDLVVCSNSTYSRVACFLNDRPYIWPADTLVRDPSGCYGYLWRDDGTPMPVWSKPSAAPSPYRRDAIRRCVALCGGFSTLPPGLERYVASHGSLPIEVEDDLLYGDPVSMGS